MDKAKEYVGNMSYSYSMEQRDKEEKLDCSEYTGICAKAAGIKNFPSTAREQYEWLKKNGETSNDYKDAQPGDFIFWDRGDNKCHTGIVTKVETVNGQVKVYVLQAQLNKGNAPTVKKEMVLITTEGKEGQLSGFNQPFIGVGRVKSLN